MYETLSNLLGLEVLCMYVMAARVSDPRGHEAPPLRPTFLNCALFQRILDFYKALLPLSKSRQLPLDQLVCVIRLW